MAIAIDIGFNFIGWCLVGVYLGVIYTKLCLKTIKKINLQYKINGGGSLLTNSTIKNNSLPIFATKFLEIHGWLDITNQFGGLRKLTLMPQAPPNKTQKVNKAKAEFSKKY